MTRQKIMLIGMVLILVLSYVVTAMVYSELPDKVPMHWNIKGEIDRWGGRESVWILPTIEIPMVILMLGLCYAVGKTERERTAFLMLGAIFCGFMFSIQCLTLASSLNFKVDMNRWMGVLMSMMFMGLGIAMKHLPRNGLAGIRLPWTMKSDEAWRITHQRSAWIITILSGFGVIVSLLGYGLIGIFISAGSLLVSVVDSYYATRPGFKVPHTQ